MITLVWFRTTTGSFALPVHATLGVRRTDGMVELPQPLPGVVGLLPGEPPISVLSVLGSGDGQVLVATSDNAPYGVHVTEVVGVRRIPDDQIEPAPLGQRDGLITGIVYLDNEMVLIADEHVLAARL